MSILLILIAWFAPMPLWLSITVTIVALLRIGIVSMAFWIKLCAEIRESDEISDAIEARKARKQKEQEDK